MERLFLESVASRYKTHPRYSGEEGVDYAVRIWLDPLRSSGQKVRLEVERLDASKEPPQNFLESDLCATIEAALEFLDVYSRINSRIYTYVIDDLLNAQRSEQESKAV